MSVDQQVFLVHGCSMLPVLKAGDHLVLRPVEKHDLQAGDILVFTRADKRKIVHRVVRTDPLQTRGDNCAKDDLPVPAESPLFFAEAFVRNGKRFPLTSGLSGYEEFQRNQRKKKIKFLIKSMIAPVFMLNPFKIPFSRLTHAEFKTHTVYYAGKRAVGWQDENGWHWMRFARFFVQPPPENDMDNE